VSMVIKTRLQQIVAKLVPWRVWVQVSFLMVWLDPLGIRLHGVCAPVFHCYSCPLATFACPIGIMAQFGALHLFPYIAVGVLVLLGALFGTVLCGWACPFGLLQDLAAKVPTPKVKIPQVLGYGRYVVLLGTVIIVPYLFGEDHALFICQFCPAGMLEGRLPSIIQAAATGQAIPWPNATKLIVSVVFIVAIFFTVRPWCRVLCPLGAIFSLFNRFSLVFLKLDINACTDCKHCHRLCKYEGNPEKTPNSSDCIRCFECTKCGPNALNVGTVLDRQGAKPLVGELDS
jgi:ferredoxin-type protein NapH